MTAPHSAARWQSPAVRVCVLVCVRRQFELDYLFDFVRPGLLSEAEVNHKNDKPNIVL